MPRWKDKVTKYHKARKKTILMEIHSQLLNYKLLTFILILMRLISAVYGRCRNGYTDIDPGSNYCYFIPYLKNNPSNENQHPDAGKSQTEAESFCKTLGGGTLAYFESETDLIKLLNYFQSHYVIRDMFRDQTVVRGVYFPNNSSICPEPPVGCALWYFGLKKDTSTNIYRWSSNAPLTFDIWAPELPEINLISASIPSKNCVAGPCSSTFGLCKVDCSKKLSFICMSEKIASTLPLSSNPISSLPLIIPPIQTTSATPTSTTENSQAHEMPESMGTIGGLIMGVAEMVLPEMVMNAMTQFMHNTNGLIYSGNGIFGRLFNFGFSFR